MAHSWDGVSCGDRSEIAPCSSAGLVLLQAATSCCGWLIFRCGLIPRARGSPSCFSHPPWSLQPCFAMSPCSGTTGLSGRWQWGSRCCLTPGLFSICKEGSRAALLKYALIRGASKEKANSLTPVVGLTQTNVILGPFPCTFVP